MGHPGSMIVRLVGWWAALLAAYAVLVSSLDRVEVVAGAVIAALAGIVPAAATRDLGPPAPPGRLHWRYLLWLPVDIARDAVLLARRLVGPRNHIGLLDVVHLPAAGEAAAVRAYAVLVTSTSPGCYVIDVEVDDAPADSPGDVRVHRLAARRAGDRVIEA